MKENQARKQRGPAVRRGWWRLFCGLLLTGGLLLAGAGCSTAEGDGEASAASPRQLESLNRMDPEVNSAFASQAELEYTPARPQDWAVKNTRYTYRSSANGRSMDNVVAQFSSGVLLSLRVGNGDGDTRSSTAEALLYGAMMVMENDGPTLNPIPAVRFRMTVDPKTGQLRLSDFSVCDPPPEALTLGQWEFFKIGGIVQLVYDPLIAGHWLADGPAGVSENFPGLLVSFRSRVFRNYRRSLKGLHSRLEAVAPSGRQARFSWRCEGRNLDPEGVLSTAVLPLELSAPRPDLPQESAQEPAPESAREPEQAAAGPQAGPEVAAPADEPPAV